MEPSVQTKFVPDEVDLDALLKESKSLDVRGAYFDGLKSVHQDRKRSPSTPGFLEQDEEEGLSWSRLEASMLEDISNVKECFRTPKRLKMGAFLVLDTDTTPEKVMLDPLANVSSPSLEDTVMLTKEKNQSGLRTVLGESRITLF